jgi:hypothetical protein
MPDPEYLVAILPIYVVLIAPHVALGIAWTRWALSPPSFQVSRLQTIFQFSGLVVCSLNIAIFWMFTIWMHFHQPDLSWWKVRDKVESVCNCLIVLAFLAGVLGKGRTRRVIPIAAVAFWPIWIIHHLGVL